MIKPIDLVRPSNKDLVDRMGVVRGSLILRHATTVDSLYTLGGTAL